MEINTNTVQELRKKFESFLGFNKASSQKTETLKQSSVSKEINQTENNLVIQDDNSIQHINEIPSVIVPELTIDKTEILIPKNTTNLPIKIEIPTEIVPKNSIEIPPVLIPNNFTNLQINIEEREIVESNTFSKLEESPIDNPDSHRIDDYPNKSKNKKKEQKYGIPFIPQLASLWKKNNEPKKIDKKDEKKDNDTDSIEKELKQFIINDLINIDKVIPILLKLNKPSTIKYLLDSLYKKRSLIWVLYVLDGKYDDETTLITLIIFEGFSIENKPPQFTEIEWNNIISKKNEIKKFEEIIKKLRDSFIVRNNNPKSQKFPFDTPKITKKDHDSSIQNNEVMITDSSFIKETIKFLFKKDDLIQDNHEIL